MELTSLQRKAVEQLAEQYRPQEKITCEFKAPTGSGKTLMATAFVSMLIERHPDERFIFVIATPSSSSLPEAFERKMNLYKSSLSFSKFEVEYIQSPSTTQKAGEKLEAIPHILPERNKVYIFGKASFGKGRLLQEYGIIDDFVNDAVGHGYKLIYIRDEAHIGGEAQDRGENARNFETLMQGSAAFVLKMTATPTGDERNRVILSEKNLNDPALNEGAWLLKTQSISLLERDMQDTEMLGDAIRRFRLIREEYASLLPAVSIHPAMLIQVDNEPTEARAKAAYREALAGIKRELSNANLAWVQYFGNDDKESNRVYKGNFSLHDITRNDNEIDAIIFKIGPATGWDIPRACMLVQLRNVCSQNLNVQTLGRIKRNPYPGLARHEVTDKYYLYSNLADNGEGLYSYTYRLKQKKSALNPFLGIDITNKNQLKLDKKGTQAACTKAMVDYLRKEERELVRALRESFPEVNGRKVYRKPLSANNGRVIYTLVDNPFIFLRDYKRLATANSFLCECLQEAVAGFCRQRDFQPEFVMTVLLQQHRTKLRDTINKLQQYKPNYRISEKYYAPDTYVELFSGKPIEEETPAGSYLFSINGKQNKQPLDSVPEQSVFNCIKQFIRERMEDEEEELPGCNIALWAKNATTSNIYGEYLDANNKIRHSYFDFIIKFENGVHLYIEAKGDPDIDADKTSQLKKAYASYFETQQGQLFFPRLFISVWEVNKTTGHIRTSTFCAAKLRAQLGEPDELPARAFLQALSELPAE